MPCLAVGGLLPPWRSSSHRSPQRSALSTVEGETRTGSPASTSGRVVGERPQTPPLVRVGPAAPRPPASRASCAAAACAQLDRRGRGSATDRAQLGHQRRQRQRPPQLPGRTPSVVLRRDLRRSASTSDRGSVRAGGCGPRPRCKLGQEPAGLLVAAGAGGARVDRGHQQRPPGPGGRHVEQPPLLVEQRGRPGPRCRRLAGLASRPAATSTSRSEPSTLPRSRRSGQTPSCTPATTTTSHSSPLAAWAVRIRTASPRSAAGGQRVGRQLLVEQVVEERLDAGPRAAGR